MLPAFVFLATHIHLFCKVKTILLGIKMYGKTKPRLNFILQFGNKYEVALNRMKASCKNEQLCSLSHSFVFWKCSKNLKTLCSHCVEFFVWFYCTKYTNYFSIVFFVFWDKNKNWGKSDGGILDHFAVSLHALSANWNCFFTEFFIASNSIALHKDMNRFSFTITEFVWIITDQ